MLISLNALKQYVSIPEDLSTQSLLELIGTRLVEIESATDLSPKYQGVHIVKVISAEKIPDTHLTLCQIDVGSHTAEFSDQETVQVVCGAPNVHTGMLAVWLAPGTVVPSTYGNENFRLGARKLQGYESNGMLAAFDELDLGCDHAGIVEIDPKTAQAGDSFAEIFDLNDIIIDVENKSLTHRPDCFGLIGFAREVAGILGQKFTEPSWPELPLAEDVPLLLQVDAELCPRYSCAVFDLPDNEPSKFLTPAAVFLAKSGMRSIDPMVDLTNILMLQTGQPLHAFDYDKLVSVGGTTSPKIIVRAAEPGEELQLLDGKVISCIPEDILITSNNVPVALAGAMGGKNTEIDASTKRVVLESASFSLFHLRKTQMAHGIFSEAITRFTKGQPAAMTMPVLAEAVSRLGVQPLAVADSYPDKARKNVVKITTDSINRLLGTSYEPALVRTTLENVGFIVEEEKGDFSITVPVWRTDIRIPEDIIEEVGRLLGYDNIPLTLPSRPFLAAEVSPLLQLKTRLRSLLSDSLGLHELLTYSFVSRNLLSKVHLDPDQSYEITNSISPELQCFRQQIAPSLLDKVRENLKSGHKSFTLYELNQVTDKSLGLTDESTPCLHSDLGIVHTGDFYSLKALILALFQRGLKLALSYAQMAPHSKNAERYPYLEPLHSVDIFYQGEPIGAFGEVKASVLREFKLDQTITACELELDQLADAPQSLERNFTISKFPFVERDLTLKVSSGVAFGRFRELIDQLLEAQGLVYTVTPLSIYQPSPDSPTKNLSFHLKFSNPAATLDSSAISDIMEKITIETAKIGAEIV